MEEEEASKSSKGGGSEEGTEGANNESPAETADKETREGNEEATQIVTREESQNGKEVEDNLQESRAEGEEESQQGDGNNQEEECPTQLVERENIEGECQQEEEEEQDEQQVATFAEEDSVSRDSTKFHGGLGDESSQDNDNEQNGNGKPDPISEKMDFVDEGQSMDAVSLRSEEQSNLETPEGNREPVTEMIGEESSDSKLSSGSREKTTNNDQDQNQGQEADSDGVANLMADESMIDDDDDEGENLVAEVDISSMMEINFDEDDSQSQSQDAAEVAEPEVIPLDSDDEANDTNKIPELNGDSQPVVISGGEAIYQVDEHDNITEVDLQDATIVEVSPNSSETESTPSRRPRRAAAEAAAKTIQQISAVEQGEPASVFRTRRKSQEDGDFDVNTEMTHETSSPTPRQKCRVCKKSAPCSIVIRQYGSDIFLCSNSCFNKFRNQGTESQKKCLPCSKCGIMNDSSNNPVYFWETMNFCTDLCVGRYQMDVGSKCCTCGNNVPWNSLGKYCVRFGSDIRQFCMPQCLESYKKNARVCFNCQLDIRRAGNVILANIPSKNTPKEFCSNDCVEMYCERNLHQPTRAKPQPEHPCCMCRNRRVVHRELVLPSGSFKTCSEACWRDALHSKGISKTEKCEMCVKFVSMDLGFTTPVYWISTMEKVHGFCSHVCKNLYILNNRKILACTSCKVKKYNYDLIEYFKNTMSSYAVCSLACLPKPSDYIKSIQNVVCIPQPTSDKTTINLGSTTLPMISSVSSLQSFSQRVNGPVETLADEIIELDDDDDDIQIGDSDRILDILTMEEIAAVVNFLENRPKMRDAKCMVKPKTRTVETQTDVSELNEMERITLVPDDIVHYVPVPIPTLIHVPFPGYFLESPCPVPFPIPIPIPIPIPVIIPTDNKQSTFSSKETRNPDDDDDENDKSDRGKNGDTSTSTRTATVVPVNISNTSNNANVHSASGNAGGDSSNSVPNPSSDRPSEGEGYRVKSSPADIKITADPEINCMVHKPAVVHHHHNNNALTPTRSMSHTPPEVNRRGMTGSGHNFPSPSYSQDCCAYPTSIFPSPVSNYSPTYGSSPGPPLTPVAPIPPATAAPTILPSHPAVVNHPIQRDVWIPPTAPPVPPPPVPGPYSSSYAMSTRTYMPPSAPVIRPPVVPPVGSGYSTHSSTSLGYANAPPPSLPISTIIPQHSSPKIARVENALRAWKMMFGPASDPRAISSMELASKLCDLINRGCKPNGERYRADVLLLISLGIQQLLRDNNRVDKLFYDNMYYNYVLAFTDRAERELMVGIHARIEEIHFWETSELGASSPGVLLFTLIFMFHKLFGFKTWEMHAGLQFSNVVVQSRYDHFGRCLKYMTVVGISGVIPTEIPEDVNKPDRCLIKLYEFYCFKNEIQSGPFYKCLRQDYTPRSPWFTSQPLDQRHIYQMLVRASMICNNDNFS